MANNDLVSCTITPSLSCVSVISISSNVITASITASITPTIVIAASNNPICNNSSVTFTATITNGGSTPVYQWKLNGAVVGTNSATFTSNTLINNDVVTCELTSNEPCATSNLVTSMQ